MSQEMRNKERERRSKSVPLFESVFIGEVYKTDDYGNKIIIEKDKWVQVANDFKMVTKKSKMRYRK